MKQNVRGLHVSNRQKTRAIDLPLFRTICRVLVTEYLEVKEFELGIFLVADPEMAEVNQTHLAHEGSTDVITFPYSTPDQQDYLQGEIFICVDEALRQAKRFKVSWQSELTRYLIHGLLHIRGYDDLEPSLRRTMKREENRLLQRLSSRFPLSALERQTKLRP